MLLTVLSAMVIGGSATAADESTVAAIPLKIEYSLDGRQFTTDAPVIAPGGKVWVRASWEGFQRPEGAKQPYLSYLNAKMDFASANGGKQAWAGKSPYIQRVVPPYVAIHVTSFTYAIDLGSRSAQTVGYMNKWSQEENQFIDAPLGACEALAPGSYEFTLRVYYHAKPGGPVVGRGEKSMTLTIKKADDKDGQEKENAGAAAFLDCGGNDTALAFRGANAASPQAKAASQPPHSKRLYALPRSPIAAVLAQAAIAAVEPAAAQKLDATTGANDKRIFVSPTGDDAADGSKAHPLATLGKALKGAGPGMVIELAPGTYREGNLVMTRGGGADNPLVIQAQKPGSVLIKASKLATDWQPDAAQGAAQQGAWKIEKWPVNSQQLFMDGQPLQQIGVHNVWQEIHDIGGFTQKAMLPPVGNGRDDLKPGSFFYDTASKTLYCMLPDQSDPNQHEMEAGFQDFVLQGGQQSHVVLRGLVFMHSNMTAKSSRNGGIVTTGPANWTIEDCEFRWGDFGGLGLWGDRHIVRRCRISDNGAVGVNANGSDEAHGWAWHNDRPPQHLLLEDLTVSGNNYRRFYDQWHAGGMKLVPNVRSATIRRCTITDNHGAGIWFDGGLGDNVIQDNLVQNNTTGIFYEIAAPAQGDKLGALIRNNRVIGSKHQGIYIAASESAIVENNTCYGNRWNIVLHGMPRREFGGRKLAHNRVRNNLLGNPKGNIDLILFTGKDTADNIVDGNFYVLPADARKPDALRVSVTQTGYDQGVRTDLTALRTQTGCEEHGQVGDPKWIDAGGGDFRLAPDSPAAGKGWQSEGVKSADDHP
ncbi:MAG: right-handed parallel beta-helix repeat-containing protein [Phycisphaeraceae bacterium]